MIAESIHIIPGLNNDGAYFTILIAVVVLYISIRSIMKERKDDV